MILIATYSQDMATIKPVAEILKAGGDDVLIYLADNVASGKAKMSIKIDKNGDAALSYSGKTFKPGDIEAAWYRRPNAFSHEPLDKVFSIYYDRQRKACQDAMWFSIPPERWLNPPEILDSTRIQNKIYQLKTANELGFTTPVSFVGNDWNDLDAHLGRQDLILKLPNGRLYKEHQPHFLITQIISYGQRENLRKTVPFPGIWQQYVNKKREWRVTVVGDKAFPAAIYTKGVAKSDWRKYQFDKRRVIFKAEKLPEDIISMCVKMLKQIGVRFGAFDLIENEKGEFVFLEMNLSGQYQWLVEELGLKIPAAIADELISIKNKKILLTQSLVHTDVIY